MGDQPQNLECDEKRLPSTPPDPNVPDRPDPGEDNASQPDGGDPTDTPSMLMLAELERRVRSLESRVNELSGLARAPRWQLKPSDMVRWVLWLMVIGFLAFYWTRLGGPR
jgi:hypothetical protein